jgi:signal transduction histidine kinase/CheY-like chemotaxis protein
LWHEVKTDKETFEIIARPVERGAEPGKWVLVLNDVTREREIRARLQQQDRLAAVGQLAAGIAHDFNNIMAVIVLYAQMVARSSDLSTENRERITVINQQAWHASQLIEQLLDFSRRAVLERHPLDLLLLLKEQISWLERTLPEHIDIELVAGEDTYIVDADPTRMQQVLTNLALNARDAMPEGGTLCIALEQINVEGNASSSMPDLEPGAWLQLSVSDTGTGIAPEILPRIFEPFFTTKRPGEGSGLGLAQVYGLVKQHGGDLDVRTQVGEGTTFRIYLPVLLEQQPQLPPITTQTFVTGHGETLLVVEDDAALRQALIDSLTVLNYHVIAAAHGREALEILERRADEVALILSDLVMPEMGGQALFHALQQRGATTPMIILSGHPMKNELETLQAEGLTAWMLKPPDMEQLSRLLARVLEE